MLVDVMKLVAQPCKISNINFDDYVGPSTKSQKNGPLLPASLRAIFVGASNAGKTNIMFNLIFDPNGLRFENIYVYSKSLYQPKYKFLSKVLPEEIGYFPFGDATSVISPEEAKPNSLMIFDDIACEKHDHIRAYFTMGRHKQIDSIYLGQTYSKIPKQLIRDNTNFLVIFQQDGLKHIFPDFLNTDMTYDHFKEICNVAWQDKHGFLVIDKDSELRDGRYRVGFDQFVKL